MNWLSARLVRYIMAALLLLAPTTLSAGTFSYSYDSLGRVTQVTSPNGAVVTYTYDPVGNRMTQSGAGGPPVWGSVNWNSFNWQ